MGFWAVFKGDSDHKDFANSLHAELRKKFLNRNDDDLTKIACIAGLLAHLAFADLNVEDSEESKIKEILERDFKLDRGEAEVTTELAIKHAKEFSGLENHLLTKPLTELMDQDKRYQLLKALFAVAASDGSVSALEAEEARLIAKGLRLSNQHYLAARAEVQDKILALK